MGCLRTAGTARWQRQGELVVLLKRRANRVNFWTAKQLLASRQDNRSDIKTNSSLTMYRKVSSVLSLPLWAAYTQLEQRAGSVKV